MADRKFNFTPMTDIILTVHEGCIPEGIYRFATELDMVDFVTAEYGAEAWADLEADGYHEGSMNLELRTDGITAVNRVA